MKRRSIHQKLTTSYVILITAVALVILIGFSLTIWLSALPNIRLTMQSKTNELENRVNEQIAYLERAADTAFLNLNNLNFDVFFGKYENELKRYNEINRSLYLMRQVYTDVKWVLLFDMYGNVYADNSIIESAIVDSFDETLHASLEDGHGRTMSYGLRSISGINNGEPVLLVGKMVRNVSNIRKIGYLYVAADENLLQELYGEQMVSEDQNIYICGADGIVLSSTEAATIGSSLDSVLGDASDNLIVQYEGTTWLYQQKWVESVRANIVLMIPVLELYRSSAESVVVVLIAALSGLCLALYESGNLTKRILTPLQELTDKADKIREGNMNVRCDSRRTDDEIGMLSSSFNDMLDRIEKLIERVEWEQKEKLKTELAVQQNRIQPHFLYNTLNTICALCGLGRAEEAARMTDMLARYYRMVLSDGKDIVTIEQELHNVELYLQIKLIGSGDSISYSINCDECARLLPIPKLTMQPLVENAIKHAFSDGRDGMIDITASANDTRVVIIVADNGVGMDEKVFENILISRQQGHFGIFSVCERIKLLTSGNYKLEACSVIGDGTKVTLSYGTSGITVDGVVE